MSSHDEKVVTVNIERFSGGKGLMTKAGGIGVVGLLAAMGGMFTGDKSAYYSYLVAFSYWAGIAITSLAFLMILHTFRAKWPTLVRRPLEAMATGVFIMALLFIPLGLSLSHVYSWTHPENFTGHAAHLIHHKHGYLNTGFFIGRTVGYFAIAIIISQLLFSWSTKQDSNGKEEMTLKLRKLGTAALPLMALVLTFAGLDWLMTLDPLWFSTIFGVYYFGGSMGGVLAIWILVVATLQIKGTKNTFGPYVTVEQLHNISKLFFAFTAFWGYIAASQFILIWIAGLPEETPFYIIRMRSGWAWVGLLLIFARFLIPFFALLSRARKRDPRKMRFWAVWVLIMHFVDIYWLVFPTVNEEHATFHWTLIPAWLGIGGIATAFVVWRLRGQNMVPVKDPYLSTSLRYRQP